MAVAVVYKRKIEGLLVNDVNAARQGTRRSADPPHLTV